MAELKISQFAMLVLFAIVSVIFAAARLVLFPITQFNFLKVIFSILTSTFFGVAVGIWTLKIGLEIEVSLTVAAIIALGGNYIVTMIIQGFNRLQNNPDILIDFILAQLNKVPRKDSGNSSSNDGKL